MVRPSHVIVGASLAGGSAAAELRKWGFDGRVVLIGDERERPYERPELSKKYLRGEIAAPVAVRGLDEADIELVTGPTVDAIDVRRREVRLGGTRIPFDRLLLATGSVARRPSVPGVDLDGVLTLRTVADADRIRDLASAAASVVVVGGGWIGSEVAASLRQLGRDVTLVLAARTPLERVVGPEVGGVYRAVHEEQGVRLVPGTTVTAFDGHGRVEAVRTADGRRIAADLVVLGVGVAPRTELAAAAGLAVDNGILVDEQLRTSAPGIFAAGDVANAIHPRYGPLRIEHWDNAKRQGQAAAGNMLGEAMPYDRIPYFYSDQYDLGMEFTGLRRDSDRVVFRGDPESREFIAFWLDDGRVVAGMNVNVWDVAPAIEQLIVSRDRVDIAHLMDASRPLGEVARAA